MGGYFAGASLAFVALSFSVNRLVARKSRLNAGTT
jgi:hypothetical protein